MPKKRAKKKKVLDQAANCNETCANYADCKNNGNTERFLKGVVCTDFCLKEKVIDDLEAMAKLLNIPSALYTRCRKEIGMSDAQIASYSSADALLQAANGMHPKSNIDARVSEGKPPEPVKFEENMPDTYVLESVLEAKFIKTNRDHFDRGNLQACLRRINRRYGPQEPVRIVQDRSFVVVKRELVTKYTIYFKE